MPDKRPVFSNNNRTPVIDILFYLSSLAAILMSILLDKKQLTFVVPLVISIINIKYIVLTKNKAKPFFIIGLLVLSISDVLSLYSFEKYFMWISILTTITLLCFTLSLKKYLTKSRLKSILSLSVLLSILLISYIAYSILDLILLDVSNHELYFISLSALSLLIYIITFSIIYINDTYRTGTILLLSGALTFIQITLITVNEFVYFSKNITFFVIICHILSVYLLMTFLVQTKPLKPEDIQEKYI